MTVSNTPKKFRYEGDGTTDTFAYNAKIFTESDISVQRVVRATNAAVDTLTLNTDYTVTINSNNTATVVVTNGSKIPTALQDIILDRNLVKSQTVSLPTGTVFPAKTVENALDKQTMLIQDLSETVDRSLKFSTRSTVTDPTLADPEDDKVLVWDGTTGKTKNGPSATVIETSVDEATSAAAAAQVSASSASFSADSAAASAAQAANAVSSITYLWCGTAGGAANALTLTTGQSLASYTTGMKFRFLVATTNTSGTVTVNVDSIGAKTIKKTIGGALVTLAVGDLPANTIIEIEYDGTDFQVLNIRTYGQGADIASASTVNLDTATGDYVHITGTTNITAFTLAHGRECTVVFDGILTLTNGASLLNITAANITTAAGDRAVFRGEASGIVRMIDYTRADGTGLVAASSAREVFIKGVNAASDTSISFINGVSSVVFDGTYDEYLLVAKNLVPSALAGQLILETTTDGGSTWDTTIGDYAYVNTYSQSVGGINDVFNDSEDPYICISLCPTGVPTTGHGLSGEWKIIKPSNTSFSKQIYGFGAIQQDTSTVTSFQHAGTRNTNSAINGFRLRFNTGSGVIATGRLELWGVKNA